jgi:hypothetical protein
MHDQHSVVYVVMIQEAMKYKLIKIKGEPTCNLVNSYILTISATFLYIHPYTVNSVSTSFSDTQPEWLNPVSYPPILWCPQYISLRCSTDSTVVVKLTAWVASVRVRGKGSYSGLFAVLLKNFDYWCTCTYICSPSVVQHKETSHATQCPYSSKPQYYTVSVLMRHLISV